MGFNRVFVSTRVNQDAIFISGRCNGTDIEFPSEMSVELSTELIEGNICICVMYMCIGSFMYCRGVATIV